MADWSSKISAQFNLNLPADVVAWFDGELWKECSEMGFFQPEEPESLLDPKSCAVRGGLMLPDTLPILGNGFGDALCLRFNPTGTVSEVVRWLHEGGDWTPYGANLCEALLLDARLKELRDALPPEVLEDDFLKTALESKHSADFFQRVCLRWSTEFCAEASQP